MSGRGRALLWFDGGAAITGGVLVVAFRELLAGLYAFPDDLLLFLGLSNLAYGSYSITLATLTSMGKTASRRSVELLVIANSGWVVVCAIVLVSGWPSATAFGLAHVGAEALFVGSLAFAEYRFILRSWGKGSDVAPQL